MVDPLVALARSMNTDLFRLRTISQNLANINTPAYKREIPQVSDFDMLVRAADIGSANGQDISSLPMVGNQLKTDFSQGAIKHTGNPDDIAIGSDAFLAIKKDGKDFYTRRGELTIDNNGFLALKTGGIVQGTGGAISLQNAPFTIDKTGVIEQGGVAVDQLKLVKFNSTGNAKYDGGGLFSVPTADVSLLDTKQIANVEQGYIETSNVNTADEMVSLVQLVRHFEGARQVVRSYDTMLDSSINVLANFNG